MCLSIDATPADGATENDRRGMKHMTGPTRRRQRSGPGLGRGIFPSARFSGGSRGARCARLHHVLAQIDFRSVAETAKIGSPVGWVLAPRRDSMALPAGRRGRRTFGRFGIADRIRILEQQRFADHHDDDHRDRRGEHRRIPARRRCGERCRGLQRRQAGGQCGGDGVRHRGIARWRRFARGTAGSSGNSEPMAAPSGAGLQRQGTAWLPFSR